MWITSHYIAKLIPLFGLETAVFYYLPFRKTGFMCTTRFISPISTWYRTRQPDQTYCFPHVLTAPHGSNKLNFFPAPYQALTEPALPTVLPCHNKCRFIHLPRRRFGCAFIPSPLRDTHKVSFTPYTYVCPLPSSRIRINRFNGFRMRRAF